LQAENNVQAPEVASQ